MSRKKGQKTLRPGFNERKQMYDLQGIDTAEKLFLNDISGHIIQSIRLLFLYFLSPPVAKDYWVNYN